MAYDKYTWQTGEVITADKLNHIEQGIVDAPGYSVGDVATVYFDEDITTSGSGGFATANITVDEPLTSDVITVIFDGTEYNCNRVQQSGSLYYGELNQGRPSFLTYPFFLGGEYSGDNTNWTFITESAGTYSVQIETTSELVSTTPDFEKAVEAVSPPFDLGDRIAKGTNNGQVVQGAVVEGSITGNIASGYFSHAEGLNTKARSGYSHAEGLSTEATNDCSHAEGNNTIASGTNSHAEGFGGIASGDHSHVEGCNTIASGQSSHAEGEGTTANHKSQHVFGEYNILDPAAGNARGDYVEIVGNGTTNNARSNARTLDWNGNEKLKGSLTLGMDTADEVTITAAQLTALLALLS